MFEKIANSLHRPTSHDQETNDALGKQCVCVRACMRAYEDLLRFANRGGGGEDMDRKEEEEEEETRSGEHQDK